MENKQTAFEILQSKLTIEDTSEFRLKHIPEILDAMEEYATSSQTEISDEEIVQKALEVGFTKTLFIDGAKWYREQLKKK